MTQPTEHFTAPWGRTLRSFTLLVTLICLAITVILWPTITAAGPHSIHFWAGLLPVLILVGAALMTVRGYRLEGEELVVERPLWVNRFPLAGLEAIAREPELIHESRSVLGNNGFFSFMGLFRHPRRGHFRALLTDPSRTLLLRYPARSLAISPAPTEAFLAVLGQRSPDAVVDASEDSRKC